MEITRTIPVILDDNTPIADTVTEYNRYQRTISTVCFNEGAPLRAIDLHHKVYHHVDSTLKSQMKCNAIRATASAYASAKSNGKPAKRPFVFRRPSALFLYGKDFSFRKDGSLSVSTLQGRQKIGWKIPKHFQDDFNNAKKVTCLRITRDKAFFTLTLEAPNPKGVTPVGIDLGVKNAVVASTKDDTLVISGHANSVRQTKTRKRRARLQSKLAERKAQRKDTRSVRRSLKRLSRKTRNRNRTFCRETAAKLCNWAPDNAVLVFEDLRIKPKSKKQHDVRKGTRRKLNAWFFRQMTHAAQNRAERHGLALAFVDPAYTSQTCSCCGCRGIRKGKLFTCPHCGHVGHADINASQNIRMKFTVLRSSGPSVNRPRSPA